MVFRSLAAAAAAFALGLPVFAQQPVYDGFLCCNLRTDGSWASDINYAESGKTIIQVGTPVSVTGYGRYRVHVLVNGAKQAIGNDYSRDMALGAFAQRWVVTEDPRAKIETFAPRIREAIRTARVTRGMTREQVYMAVGYPVTSENPHLDGEMLRYWLSSFAPFTVFFDRDGLVRDIDADAATRHVVELK